MSPNKPANYMNINDMEISFDFTSSYPANEKTVALFKIPLRVKISSDNYSDICQIGLDR